MNTFGKVRFPVPMCYADAWGERRTECIHSMLLPHEIVAAFYRFQPRDLMIGLTGRPGDALSKFKMHHGGCSFM